MGSFGRNSWLINKFLKIKAKPNKIKVTCVKRIALLCFVYFWAAADLRESWASYRESLNLIGWPGIHFDFDLNLIGWLIFYQASQTKLAGWIDLDVGARSTWVHAWPMRLASWLAQQLNWSLKFVWSSLSWAIKILFRKRQFQMKFWEINHQCH